MRSGRLDERRAGLDGIRGIAVVLVVLVHSGNSLWPSAARWLGWGGPLGVHLFFVLSGYLITSLLLAEADRRGAISVGGFLRRRLRRLLPALVVCLIGLALLPWLRPPADELLGATATALTFTMNLAMLSDRFRVTDQPPEVLHLWSLAIEMHFYVLWAVVLWWTTRRGWTTRRLLVLTAAAVVAVALWRVYLYEHGTFWLFLYLRTDTRLDASLVGALAAVLVRGGYLECIPRPALTITGAIGLAAVVVAGFTVGWESPELDRGLYTLLALAGAAGIVAVVLDPGSWLDRLLSWSWLTWLGRVSFSLYLWHYLIFSKFERGEYLAAGPVRFVVAIGLSLIAAALSYELVEQRAVRFRRAAAD
jgi:peptidoglycan/LPS O-acetylase OafA/YrhL